LGIPSVYVWAEGSLLDSTRKLLDHNFEWVLPGHGDRIHLQASRMKAELNRLLARRKC
jgi:glyoxylase-like metal-dependent hydrolase (beta-lactamase superfamily II)